MTSGPAISELRRLDDVLNGLDTLASTLADAQHMLYDLLSVYTPVDLDALREAVEGAYHLTLEAYLEVEDTMAGGAW